MRRELKAESPACWARRVRGRGAPRLLTAFLAGALLVGLNARSAAQLPANPPPCQLIADVRFRMTDGWRVLRDVLIGVSDPRGFLRIGAAAVWEEDTVAVAHQVEVRSDVSLWSVSADLLSLGPGAVVRGPVLAAPMLPLLDPFPAVPEVSCAGPDVIVPPGEVVQLDAGGYGRIVVRHGGTLRLAPGSYTACKLVTGRAAQVVFGDGSGSTLDLARTFRLGADSFFGPAANAPRPRVTFAGRAFRFAPRALVEALVTAPGARLYLARYGTYVGSIVARDIESDRGVTVACARPLA